MPEWTKLTNARVGEQCYRLRHPSGLSIYVWPKPGYKACYATFAARYGSIDTAFMRQGDAAPTVVPAGIAHYLEHKLFESEDGDAFSRYAKTGASANAYTSFDRTAYLFSCTDRFEESLEILLDFVQSPYFTEETVKKEQGIIGQEIWMCEDNPERRVLFNLLRGLYAVHPVRLDIAGTVESIAEITPELLYGCYETFYNLHNMVLAVSGNVTPEQVLRVTDRMLRPGPDRRVERAPFSEPREAVSSRVEDRMPVAAPLFYLGYKVPMPSESGVRCSTPEETVSAAVLAELLGGRSSALYARLMDEGLVNTSFDVDYFDGPGFAAWLIGGESRDPDAVCEAFRAQVRRMADGGVAEKDFLAARSALYGSLVARLDSVENCGEMLASGHFYGRNPFDLLDAAAHLDIQSIYRRLREDFDDEASTLSVIRPMDG